MKREIEILPRGEKVKIKECGCLNKRRFGKFCHFPWYGEGVGKIGVFGKDDRKSISKSKS